MKATKQLKKLAREEELEVIEYPDGRALVVGGIVNVHWWPESKNRTAYVDGSPKGIKFASAEHVISLAVNGY
jgi:hypothetical protein